MLPFSRARSSRLQPSIRGHPDRLVHVPGDCTPIPSKSGWGSPISASGDLFPRAGQRIVRLRVVDASTGARISALQAFKRTIFICLVFPAVFTKEGRGYHDWFTNSVVVKY
eukprot:gene979-988_t